MRRKRLLLWAAVTVGVVALGLLTVVVWPGPEHGVTDENYDRITYGMTLAEVQELLGGEGEESSFGTFVVGTWRDGGLRVDVSFENGRAWQRARTRDGGGVSEVPPERLLPRLLRLP